MDPGLRTSASGMMAQQRMIDVIANNLANVNTTGFKRSRVSFQDVLYETVGGNGVTNLPEQSASRPIQYGKGVRVSAVTRVHGQGVAEITQRPLDLLLDGEGFFTVQLPNGNLAYTRDGSFHVSESGSLTTNSGYLVIPGIALPQDATNVSVSAGGIVSVTEGVGSLPIEIGRLEIARFLNPSGLLTVGENLYTETAASGLAIQGFPQENGFGRILQGALEASNVEIVQEMTDMIAAQRAYEINAKAIQTGEEMMRATSDLIR